MCEAFSCIVSKSKKVTWKLTVDNHHNLIDLAGYEDNDDCKNFVRVEITPKNNDYINPDEWILKVDEDSIPRWFSPMHKEACWDSFKLYEKQLYKIVKKGKKIVHPFNDIKQVKVVSNKQILLLKKWSSVGNSVWYSVKGSVKCSVGCSIRDSVWDSARDSIGGPIWGSVRDSVKCSVGDSIRDSAWGYMGSFFTIPKWKYIKHKKDSYPFQPVVDLWNMGLVPSFDGKTWRLHSGKKAEIVFEISKKDLEVYGE